MSAIILQLSLNFRNSLYTIALADFWEVPHASVRVCLSTDAALNLTPEVPLTAAIASAYIPSNVAETRSREPSYPTWSPENAETMAAEVSLPELTPLGCIDHSSSVVTLVSSVTWSNSVSCSRWYTRTVSAGVMPDAMERTPMRIPLGSAAMYEKNTASSVFTGWPVPSSCARALISPWSNRLAFADPLVNASTWAM